MRRLGRRRWTGSNARVSERSSGLISVAGTGSMGRSRTGSSRGSRLWSSVIISASPQRAPPITSRPEAMTSARPRTNAKRAFVNPKSCSLRNRKLASSRVPLVQRHETARTRPEDSTRFGGVHAPRGRLHHPRHSGHGFDQVELGVVGEEAQIRAHQGGRPKKSSSGNILAACTARNDSGHGSTEHRTRDCRGSAPAPS